MPHFYATCSAVTGVIRTWPGAAISDGHPCFNTTHNLIVNVALSQTMYISNCQTCLNGHRGVDFFFLHITWGVVDVNVCLDYCWCECCFFCVCAFLWVIARVNAECGNLLVGILALDNVIFHTEPTLCQINGIEITSLSVCVVQDEAKLMH